MLYQPLTLLDCLHTYCGSCLKEWFGFQLNNARKEPNSIVAGSTPYTCPSCRAPVRDTKADAKVNTWLDMFLSANPGKARTPEESEDIKKKYTPGENVLPRVEPGDMSLRERSADGRLLDEVRTLSLREAGVESSEARRERRRRDAARSRGSRSQSSRDNSRDSHSSMTTEMSEDRRRRREAEAERRRVREGTSSSLRAERLLTGERRRQPTGDDALTARQVEHQSSLRSLISSSDIESRDMEEEILRQIREEGLLDGIDLENIDVNQEDQISERIAEAFRRRQSEREREGRRSDASGRTETSGRHRRTHTSAPPSRETSGDERANPATNTRRVRTHSRATSATSQVSRISQEEQSRPPPSMSSIQAAHLDAHSSDDSTKRRRRTTSSSRSVTTPVPVAELDARPAARSQTDLTNKPWSHSRTNIRPPVRDDSRSNTDPIVQRVFELPAPNTASLSRPTSQHIPSPHSSPRISGTAELPSPPKASGIVKNRAAPPADIFVPTSAATSTQSASGHLILENLRPAPLSPRTPGSSKITLSDRATAMGSASRPTSSSSPTNRAIPQFFPEPSLTCARCEKTHIEYQLHYNCDMCRNGEYNICLACYRASKGCLHWFGFGQSAWTKWEKEISAGRQSPNAEQPHMLRASRYAAPKISDGGAPGRRTLTTDDPQNRLQSGVFCSNCLAWANECFWCCSTCNQGEWNFCNLCVNQGKSCTHSLLPMTYAPRDTSNSPFTPTHDYGMPQSAHISANGIGNFKFLTFSTSCDICRYPIQPSQTRYHCYECVSKDPHNQGPGDYDICTPCYNKLASSRRISTENGHSGWRRCLNGHRMIICGFQDAQGGQCRIVVQDLVGGKGLVTDLSTVKDPVGTDLLQWSWGDGKHRDGDRLHKKLVTKEVVRTPPTVIPGFDSEQGFPPDGGVGMRAVAEWPRYPGPEDDDELLFPKYAELREVKDVSGEWFYGIYMGKSGLFPSNHVTILDSGTG